METRNEMDKSEKVILEEEYRRLQKQIRNTESQLKHSAQYESQLPLSSLEKENFRSQGYDSGRKKINLNEEYELVMCSMCALKMVTNDNISNIELSRNKFTIDFANLETFTYMFKFEHSERDDHYITNNTLRRSDFGSNTCLKLFEGIADHSSNLIVCTNRNAKIEPGFVKILENRTFVIKEDRSLPGHIDFLLDWPKIFRVQEENTENRYLKRFFLVTDQYDVTEAKLQTRRLLKSIVQCDIYDSFISFIKEFGSRTVALNKYDILSKLIELTLSPWVKTLSGESRNEKTDRLVEAIQEFKITVFGHCGGNTLEKIWPNLLDSDIEDHVGRYSRLSDFPLVVKVDRTNEKRIQATTKLWQRLSGKHRPLVLLGNSDNLVFSNSGIVFRTLADLRERSLKIYDQIVNTFYVSVQEHNISLKKLVEVDMEIIKLIDTAALLGMTQGDDASTRSEDPYTHFNLSANILNISDMSEGLHNTLLIVNCNGQERVRLETMENALVMEVYDYLAREDSKTPDNIIVVCENQNCTIVDFQKVCQKTTKTNVYLLQTLDDCLYAVLLIKGNRQRFYRALMTEQNLERILSAPIAVLSAPIGMGKTSMFKQLSKKRRKNTLPIFVNLKDHTNFFRQKPNDQEIVYKFLHVPENGTFFDRVMLAIIKTKDVLFFLDGLDELPTEDVDFLLDFTERSAHDGFKIWISSREHLKDKIQERLDVVAFTIEEIGDKDVLFKRKLKNLDQMEKIYQIVVDSFKATECEDLLTNSFHIDIISEELNKNSHLCQRILDYGILMPIDVLIKGYVQHFYRKMGLSQETLHIFLKSGLTHYKFLAVKHFFPQETVTTKLNMKEHEDFVDDMQRNGDKLGLIRLIDPTRRDVSFAYPQFATYLASSWFNQHSSELGMEKYLILALIDDPTSVIFNMVFAESNLLFLGVLFRNVPLIRRCSDMIKTRDAIGRSVLHFVDYSQEDVILGRATTESVLRLLIELGANVNAADKFGFTPLYVACRGSHTRKNVSELLINSGANCWRFEDSELRFSDVVRDKGSGLARPRREVRHGTNNCSIL